MNLVLFESAAEASHLPAADPRARHIHEVLRLKPGGKLFVGVVNGLRGHATLAADGPAGLDFDIIWEKQVEPPRPFQILVGLPRPQTARDLLREAAAFGVAALHFFSAEKGEASYAASTLWSSDEWSRRLREGAAQAFATNVPSVTHHPDLAAALAAGTTAFPAGAARLALDVYEAASPLSAAAPSSGSILFALGAERGWSAAERVLLRQAGFALAHLGPRVLRTETALVAALSVLLTRRGEF